MSVLTSEFLATVSTDPGVYLMMDKQHQVIYVGKALNLRKRVSSYARFKGSSHSKTGAMIRRIVSVEFIITRTEKEALILEASLIKKHRPKYNVILRDDKNYPLIKVTVQDEWPQVLMTRRRSKDGARYFGPYASSSAMWSTLRLLNSLFPLRRCKGSKVKQRQRPCLNGQMRHCLAPCLGTADWDKYQLDVARVVMILEGKNRQLISQLRDEMAQAAAHLAFEEAAGIRDQIGALEKTVEKQLVVAGKERNHDVFGLVLEGGSLSVSVLMVRHGMLISHTSFFMAEPVGSPAEILAEVVRRYYGDEHELVAELLLPWSTHEDDLLVKYLSELRGARVQIKVPQRGDLVRLVEMANTNAKQLFAERDKQKKSWQVLAGQLEKLLHLGRFPQRIECVDISNISGQQAVGSLVCFVGGQPEKKLYRHYKIKTVKGPNDYAMMAEVLKRRFDPAKDPALPDLLLLDGGKGQLNMARQVMEDLALTGRFDLAGIAKERQEEGEKLFRPGRKNPILLDRHSQLLLYLMRIRDESHRFGITFHRKLRHKAAFSSELDTIPGIGPARKAKLLKSLGSLSAIKAASEDELSQVETIGSELAAIIHRSLLLD